jgi:hypothetical protein
LFALEGPSAPLRSEVGTRFAGPKESAPVAFLSSCDSSEEQGRKLGFPPVPPGLLNSQILKEPTTLLKEKPSCGDREFASGSATIDPSDTDTSREKPGQTSTWTVYKSTTRGGPIDQSFWELTAPREESTIRPWRSESIFTLRENPAKFENGVRGEDPTARPRTREGQSEAGHLKGGISTYRESHPDPALARARRRNNIRLRKAIEANWTLISKYLPSDACLFFPFAIEGPDDFYKVAGIGSTKSSP